MEKIAQYDDDEGLALEAALAVIEKRGLRLPSNLELDKRLASDEWRKEKEMYPCWSGTLIAYKARGKPLGAAIEFEGLKVKVPRKWQAKKNVALVCDHPRFSFKDNEFSSKNFLLIPFPEKSGWFLPDAAFGIPNGEPDSSRNSKARYLWRSSGDYVGLLVRGYVLFFGDDRRNVGAGGGPRLRFGVFGVEKSRGRD